jgi:hypothetical protein
MNNISWQKCIAGRQEETGRVPGNGMISDFMLKSLDGMQPQSDAEMSITHQPELTEQIERCVQKLRYRVDTSLRLQLAEEEERLKNRVRHSLERLLLPLPPPFARSACLDSRSARHRRAGSPFQQATDGARVSPFAGNPSSAIREWRHAFQVTGLSQGTILVVWHWLLLPTDSRTVQYVRVVSSSP